MKIAIIGNGIAGVTAARHIRKQSDHEIVVISSESEYFYSRTALMYIYMGHMRLRDTQPYESWFWEKNRIELLFDHVEGIYFDKKRLQLRKGKPLSYDKLLIAVGSKSNKFGWPGQELKRVHGLYTLQDLHMMEKYSENLERAVVVGGGLIGVEMAEMFHTRKIPVTMIVREKAYWNNVLPPEEAEMISRHIVSQDIDLKLSSNLGEIVDDGTGHACAVTIKETGEQIPCGFVGLTAGVSPNVDFLRDSELEINRGILVDRYLQTNLPDVYAAGDCAQLREAPPGRRSIEAVWYTGRMMGECVAGNICGTPQPYNPGIWFNSAKFFDIEYQVYGFVPNVIASPIDSLYWENEDGRHAVRLVYHMEDMHFLGVNVFGIRFRQAVCEQWIRDKTHIEDVLRYLRLADFNPEFFPEYEQELLDIYNRRHGTEVRLRRRRSHNAVLSFLNFQNNRS